MTMNDEVLITREGHVLQIRLNRPQRRNALTTGCYATMAEAIEKAESDLSVCAIVFMGAEGNFCAGHDLSDFPDEPPGDEQSPAFRFIRSLVESSVPVVAGVEGVAVGVGATMLLHFDCVVADPDATFLMPFVNLAVVPEAGASLLLPKMLGYARAADLLMRGNPFDGRRAYELGIASTLAEPGQAEAVALETAAVFAGKPPQAMRKTKRLLKGDTQALLDRIRLEERMLFECFASDEAAEMMAVFQKKRPSDQS